MAAVLDAFASKLADILMGMAKDEVEMLLGVPGEITKLETTIGDLSSILGDAERRRIRDSAVERWVRELKDVMYDADDILDLCQIMEDGEDPSSSAAAPKTTSGCWSMPKMFFCFRNPVVAHEIGRKIQALNQRLEDIEKRSSRFGFITQAINSSGYSIGKASHSLSGGRTGSVILQSDVVGEKIVEDTKKIVDLLLKVDSHAGLKGNNNVVVAVAITGMGGIGKTTLARMVFSDSKVEENFEERIWLSVNQDVNEISVLQSVIASFGANHDGFVGNKDLLERALKDIVQQKKKFLLVMDDVWSEKVWNELLRAPLSYGASGSCILVTSRNARIAHGMKARHLHQVDKLETEDAWILLKSQVVSDESDETDVQGLKGAGIKIVERCECLPLAIKVIGGLLQHKSRTIDAWMDVCNHYSWSTMGIDEDINKAVYLSYEDLPSHLKQCFLYCSLFPKHVPLIRSAIIRLWIAEGYMCNKMSSRELEDLGLEYYEELVSRNLLEPHKRTYGISVSTMHDVVRACAQNTIKDGGAVVIEGQEDNITLGSPKLRYLCISNRPLCLDILQKQDSLRTLMIFGSTALELKDLLNNLSCLRVLHLVNVNLVEIPETICHLKHLRFLYLSGARISTIPRGIGNLKFLQAIELCGCTNISQLPNNILKLRRLRSLNLSGTAITSVPRGFQNLKDLVNILGFPTHSEDSADGWCSLEELGPLSKLQKLEISHLEKTPSGDMATKAMLSSKHHLTELNLIFTSRLTNGDAEDNTTEEEHRKIEEVLANICPPTCIEILEIKGYFARGLPQWMRTMSAFGSLRRLVLQDYACCTQLPNGLGQLPFLDYFWVQRAPFVQCIGHEILLPSFGDNTNSKDMALILTGTQNKRMQPHHMSCGAVVAFPKLVRLGFQGMLRWTKWEWEQQVPAMPALETLWIEDCKLQHLPAGLAHHACRLRGMTLTNILHLASVENFPSLASLWLLGNPSIERIRNNPSLQQIVIRRCPSLKELDGLPSLRSLEWGDLDAKALPQYLRVAKLNNLRVICSLSLLKLIALQDNSSEWGKIRHVQQVEASEWKTGADNVKRHIYYTKEPYSFYFDLDESTDGDGEEEEHKASEAPSQDGHGEEEIRTRRGENKV